ncbi:hypothetical protein [Pseudomonas wadenswilerensis]|uniref:Uncharacterized protein n=1 Tax=Pseudomonas wadenswilerensis TaxID=1785161 RepID=A0A380SUA0_9PSED|nr:hypothetical protein [Pseudomonas wadenswilerensis]SUQ61562.1 hypothetical protein CCOS864_00986 [Pseudomonas wadenswilerensis]
MSDLVDQNPAACEWLESTIRRHSQGIYGHLVSAVVWTDAKNIHGELLVPADPHVLVDKLKSNSFILLQSHDPGKPIGQVLEGAYFESTDGHQFVVAVLGYYAGGDVLSFKGLGIDTRAVPPSPSKLPPLSDDCWMELATDPREVDEGWLDLITREAPLRIERTELSHNAESSAQELIRLGLVYLTLVWNPFVTSIASEAGKGAYTAIHAWLRKLFEELADRRNPVLDIHTHQDGCQVSFLIRGKDIKKHYVAHEGLSGAAAQAAKLIAQLKVRGTPAKQLVYEFDREALRWYPSFAVLGDKRIITDNLALIAIEQLPSGLSLGFSREKLLTK